MIKSFPYIFLLAVLFSVASCTSNQKTEQINNTDSLTSTSTSSEDDIVLIQQEFDRINTVKSNVKSYTFKCDEKVLATYYLENEKPVKVIIDWGTVGDYYHREEFYYQDGKLIFNYDFLQGGPACEGCQTLTEKRNYIKNDKVIRYKVGEETKDCTTCEFTQDDKAYQIYAVTSAEELKAILCK